MKCEKYSNLIQDFAENELDAPLADEVSLHIFACLHCERELENLMREKEIYAQFLFEIEPPQNLSQRFQARLENEIAASAVLPAPKNTFGERLANLFSWRHLLPLTAAFSALLIVGFGVFWSNNSTNESARLNDQNTGKNELILTLPSPQNEIEETPTKEIRPAIVSTKNETSKNSEKKTVEKIKIVEPPRARIESVKMPEKNRPIDKKSNTEKTPILSEEDLRILELQKFERQTAAQMEKIEMLLRSFRNARFSEEAEQYEVSYEQQQARKLLGTNEKLRTQAENYGDFFTKEMLDKVEPYLLDIANLETNPSAEMVLDIKQRVRNQNLIASLQEF